MFLDINFFHYSFIIFLIISLSYIFSNLFSKNIAETLSTSVLFVMFFLYWFAIFDILEIGFYLLVISIFILTCIYVILKRKYLNKFFSIGVLVYTSLVFIIAYIFKDYFIYVWDDLSHWGLTAKDIYFESVIIKRDYNDYPIGTRLFQYFILKIYGNYNESVLLTYFYMLYFSFVVYPLKNINMKYLNNFLIVILYLILALLLPICFIIFDNFSPFKIYRFLMVDLLLGLSFGFGIYIVSTKKYFSIYDALQIFLLIFFLVQIKVVGLMFAVTILLWIIIRNKDLKKAIREGLFFIIPILLSKISWVFYIKYHDYSSYLSDRFHSSKKVINSNEFLEIYINSLQYRKIFLYFSVMDLLLLFFIVGVFCIIIYKKLRFYIIKLYLLLFTLFLVYNLGLYFTYINVFHEVERVGLFSFERYQNLLFSGFIFIIFLFIPKILSNIKSYLFSKVCSIMLIILCISTGYFTYNNYKSDISIPNYAKKLRLNVEKIIVDIPQDLESKKIIMISDDFPRLILRYLTGLNILKYTSKEKPNIIVLYNKEKYKKKISEFFNSHNIKTQFEDINSNIIIP